MSDGKHPLIQYNNKTIDKEHSLILCIGREPSNVGEIGDRIQPYYFKEIENMDKVQEKRVVTRCSFWNISHGVIAHFDNNKEAYQLKHEVNQKGCSPIIYADALNKAIPNAIVAKGKLRNNTNEEFKLQAKKIFNNDLIKRTRLIMMSGLEKDKRYDAFRDEITKLAKQSNPEIQVIDVPFFYGTNKSKIIEKVESQQEIVQVIHEILDSWEKG